MPDFGRNHQVIRAARQEAVNAERARRLANGVTATVSGYGNVALQGRIEDQVTLTALKDAALLRIQSGDTTTLTQFRDRENTDHDLTPPQLVELWQHGTEWASLVYKASWVIKDMDPIPEDFADDAFWPPVS